MPTKMIANSSNYEPMPAGNFPARLVSLVNIGTIPVEYQGQQKFQYKVRLTFEFPTKTKVFNEEKGEQPYVLSCEFTLSTSPKGNLRPFLENWQGKAMSDAEAMDLDLEEWVGKEGLANVIHTQKGENTYANIASISPLPEGLKCPKQVNPTFILNFQEKWDQEAFDKLPDFIKDKIKSSDEYATKFQLPVAQSGRDADTEINLFQ